MKRLYAALRPFLYFCVWLLFLFLLRQTVFGQCVPVDPGSGNFSQNPPLQYNCLYAGDPLTETFTLTFQGNISNATIDWGDGTVQNNQNGTSFTHTYTTDGIFNYTITQGGCTITGVFVNQYNNSTPGNCFGMPPATLLNKRCVPEALTINNCSSNMNGFTLFNINWGDGADTIIDYRSLGQNVSHTYQRGTTGCDETITITYENRCGVIPGGVTNTLVYTGFYFIDIDTAEVTPSSIILCDPTDVTISDASILNCLDAVDRKIKWKRLQGFANDLPFPGEDVFRDYGAAANTSITIPAASFFPIPADSTYRLQMTLRNSCGDDSTEAEIKIVSPRVPVLTVVQDSVCPKSSMSFNNITPDPSGVQVYAYDWGDGDVDTLGNSSLVSHTYDIGGNYTVKVSSIIFGYAGQVCSRIDSIDVYVLETATPIIEVNPLRGCGDTMLVEIKNKSVNLTNVIWRGWNWAMALRQAAAICR